MGARFREKKLLPRPSTGFWRPELPDHPNRSRMRVLSIPQPFAQLVVRGVKRLEIRTWDTKYRGRIAVHASSAVPSKIDVEVWKRDRDTALRFADQGWLDRDDVKALPYSAIIGTVTLAGVHLGKEVHEGNTGLFAWNWATERMEVAARDARTGELVPMKPRKTPLPVATPDDQYAWVFVDPVEIQPITDVAGLQKLWNLVGELEGVTEDREKWSRSGRWRPPEVKASRRAQGINAWRKTWESEREQIVREVEERVARRRELERIRFAHDFEQQVREDMVRYVKLHRVKDTRTTEVRLHVEPRMHYLFGGRKVVGAGEFELNIRRRLKKAETERRAAAQKESRRQKLLEFFDDLRTRVADHPSLDADNIRRLEIMLDDMLNEEEEDWEHARRDAYPEAAEKATRGAARAARREAEAREVRRREEATTPEERWAEELVELMWSEVE